MHTIYGLLENHRITFIGCTKGDRPEGALILEEVTDHPKAHWVKWSLRHRRTLKDKTALSSPLVEYFENPSRLKRFLGDSDFIKIVTDKNQAFLDYHNANPHILLEMVAFARSEKAAGRDLYAAHLFVQKIRWGNKDVNQTDQFKINENLTPWYSRAIQMVDPILVGFFRLKTSTADALIWIDGRSWIDFARANSDKLNWVEPWEDVADSDWEY